MRQEINTFDSIPVQSNKKVTRSDIPKHIGNFIPQEQPFNPPSIFIKRISSSQNVKMPPHLKRRFIFTSKNQQQYQKPISLKHYQNYVEKIMDKPVLTKLYKCGLCEMDYENLEMMCNCIHQFCSTCLTQYVKYKIGINQQIWCPEEDCKELIDQSKQFFNKLPDKIKQKYRTNKVWRQNVNNPHVRLCPRQNCSQGLINLNLDPPKCQTCGKTFCVKCEMEIHAGQCEDNFQQHFKEWKRCPSCHVFIQKNQGCNHMTCRCGNQFCFICLKSWQIDHQCNFYIPQNWCLGRLLLFLGILFFPIYLILVGTFYIMYLILGLVIGTLSGPFLLCYQMSSFSNQCCIPLSAFCLPCSFIGGAVLGVGYVIQNIFTQRRYIAKYIRFLGQI